MKFIVSFLSFCKGIAEYFTDSVSPRKIKSTPYTDITAWEYKLMYKSICTDNHLICTNCESHFLKQVPDKFINASKYFYCEICGQLYLFRRPNNHTRFNRYSIENYGIDRNFIELDVIRYKKLSKIKSKI